MPGIANILIAEDQESDAYLLQWAFKKAGLEHRFFHVLDGQHAIEYLSRKPPYDDSQAHPWPQLMLLDLKMPRLGGFEVLGWLREHGPKPPFAVVVLTSSNLPADIEKARELGAADYRIKPGGLEDMVKLAKEIDSQWLGNP